MKTKPIDLLPLFCGPTLAGGGCYAKPFAFEGKLCGTNGAVMIRLDSDAPDGTQVAHDYQAIKTVLFGPTDGPGIGWATILDSNDWPNCKTCNGSGSVVCPACGRCGHRCSACFGSGRDANPETGLDIGENGFQLSRKYAALISLLPKLRMFPPANPRDPMRFTFDGGYGAVMGMGKG